MKTFHPGSLIQRLPFAFLVVILLLSAAAPSSACAQSNSATTSTEPPSSEAGTTLIPSEWRDSKEALLRDVLRCFQAGDLRCLSSLTVNSDDYKSIVWPELPISNPRNNIPFEYVFGRHNQISRGGLALKLREFEDRTLEVVRFEERPERDRYKQIRILPVGDVIVTDGDGKQYEVRLVGSILEHDGKFKAFSYKTD